MARPRVALALQVFLALVLLNLAHSQGLQTSPYSASSAVRGLAGAVSGDSLLGPKALDSVSLSSGMFQGLLPPIPNLQFGYQYYFGNKIRTGRGTADYLLPFSLSKNSVVFGEAHTEFQNFWQTNNGFNNRVDVSVGGGYRTIVRSGTLLGVNGFYDTTRLGEKWYSSGSMGLEMAALIAGNDAIDLNFNWYGRLFDSDVIRNAFRFGPSNYDFQVGYSHELWDRGPDFRLKATGYMFDVGTNVYGWNAGAELKSRDGVFVLKYDVGNDRINNTYQTVGGFVNIGFQLENIAKGENPFTRPEPVFKSPRNLWRMLTQNVNRNWFQPAAVVGSREVSGTAGTTSGAGVPPYFIITFYDRVPGRGTIDLQTHGQTASDLVVTPVSLGCPVYGGGGYYITVAGDRPSGAITVNVVFSGIVNFDPPPLGCRSVYDPCRGPAYPVVIPAGTSTVNLPDFCGSDRPHIYRLPTCNCSDAPVTGLAGTITFTDAAGAVMTQTVTVSMQP
jgi:hypothetical protein